MSHGVVQIIGTSESFDEEFPFRPGSTSTSSGSAFFFDSKTPYLLTCCHCIRDCVDVCAILPNYGKTKFEVEVLSECYLYDIALLKLKKTNKPINYKPLTLNSNGMEETEVGDKTEAIGFPLGQENIKVTTGTVSGHQFSYYQTDTPVNPGNSGGPLLRNGKVIGIVNSGILLSNDIGYAIPIERFLMNGDLMKKGTDLSPPSYFGFLLQQPLKNQKGLYVYDLVRRKCIVSGAKPPIRVGDILLELDGYEVMEKGILQKKWMNNFISIQEYLYQIPYNSKINFKIKRGKSIISGFIPMVKKSKKEKFLPTKFISSSYSCPFCIIAGVIFVPFSKSVMSSILSSISLFSSSRNVDVMDFSRMKTLLLLLKNYLYDNQPFVMVINVLNPSLFEGILEKYDVLYTVNGKKCHTISDLKKRVYPKSTKYKSFVLKMFNGKTIEISKGKLKKENEMFAKRYNLPKLYQT